MNKMESSGSHVSMPFSELVGQLQTQYDCSLVDPQAPNDGRTNTIVLFRNFVARVHDPAQLYRTEAFVDVEVAILDALEKANFPAPRVIRTRGHEALFRWHYGEMTGHGVLLSRCPGGAAPENLPATDVAKLLGRLHAALLRYPPDFGTGGPEGARATKSAKEPTEPDEMVKNGQRVADHIRLQSEAYAALLDILVAVAGAPAEVAVQGIVHLDLVSKLQVVSLC
jgi:Ser/Thr protein kinase RdoA (MazF antagonist)